MPNRISRYCDGVMEACWLLALILAPLFFNIYSSRVFEPDKIALVRSLALVTLAAWIIKLISERGPRFTIPLPANRFGPVGAFLRLPMVLPVTAFATMYIIATIFSVSPYASLLGSYQRMQGTYSMFSYIILFAAIAANLRRRAQVERILTAVIFTSLPISLYGLLQRFERDPLPWGGDTITRVTGNMGNAIFIAAYLIMAALLCLGRVVRVFRAILTEEDQAQLTPNIIRASTYIFILAVNSLTIYFSFSRGPWLGLLAGMYIFVLGALIMLRQQAPDRSTLKPAEIGQALIFAVISLPVGALPAYGILAAVKRGWRWLWLSWVLTAVLGAGFLIALNIPNGPFESIRQMPGVGRIGRVFDEIQGDSGTGRVRVLIWGGVIKLMTPHEPLQYPDGSIDQLNALRPFIGYGPEGLYVAFNPFYPPELAQLEARNATPDRSHNETFDALATTGLIGLIIHFGLWIAVFYYSLKWLGLIGTRTRQIVFLVLVIGGAALTATGLIVWQGPEMFGVGVPFGMLLGLIVFLTLTALLTGESATTLETWRAITLISLFAAIVAHFTEIHFGIAIVSTRTHFWIYAGLMVVVGYVFPAQAAIPEASRVASGAEINKASTKRKLRTPSRSTSTDNDSWLPGLISAGIVTAILLTLGYDFITNSTRTINPMEILSQSFTYLPLKNEQSLGVLLMILGSWLLAGTVAYLEEIRRGSGPFKGEAIGISLSAALMISGLAWLMISNQLASIASAPPQPQTNDQLIQQVVDSAQRVTGVLVLFYIFIFLLVLGLGWLLAADAPPVFGRVNTANTHPVALVAYAVLPLLVIIFSVSWNLQVVQADTIYKTGLQMDNEGRPQLSVPIYRRAIELTPGEDYYYLFLGRSLLNITGAEQDATKREALLNEADSELKRAQNLNPLNPDHTANLARLNRQWAALTQDPTLRAKHAQQSDTYYDRVTHISRNSALLYNEWALLKFQLLEDATEAQAKLTKSFELDDKWEQTYQYQGDLYAWQAGQPDIDATARQQFVEKGVAAYRTAIEITERKGGNPNQIRINLANLLVGNQQWAEAVREYEQVAALQDPNIVQWQLYRQIAQLYWQLGDIAQARAYAEQALNVAPEADKQGMQDFLNSLPQS